MKNQNCASVKRRIGGEHYLRFNFDALQNIFEKKKKCSNEE